MIKVPMLALIIPMNEVGANAVALLRSAMLFFHFNAPRW